MTSSRSLRFVAVKFRSALMDVFESDVQLGSTYRQPDSEMIGEGHALESSVYTMIRSSLGRSKKDDMGHTMNYCCYCMLYAIQPNRITFVI